MSTRAIAATTGNSTHTITKDRQVLQSATPEEPPVTGLDGKSYAASKPPLSDLIDAGDIAELNGDTPAEPIEAEVVDDGAEGTGALLVLLHA